MLIQNYGLFWNEADVFWGRQGVAGSLLGVPAWSKSFGAVDFREQQGVYVLYDNNYRIVYIGQAGAGEKQRLFERLKQHKSDALAGRWSKFSWFGINRINQTGTIKVEKAKINPNISDVLNHIEAILIYAAEPPLNRQGGRFGESVEQYLQYRDKENLGLLPSEMIAQILEKVQSL
jgi:hypothetical protein